MAANVAIRLGYGVGGVVAPAALARLRFAPSVDEMYPNGPSETRVVAGPVASLYEGAVRPGHFDGMLTVVAKMLHLTAPDVTFFGEKDGQQLALVRRMVKDLNFPVEIVGVPTGPKGPFAKDAPTDNIAIKSVTRKST